MSINSYYFTLPRLQAVVKPQCGRVVGFRAGQENLHGVTAVTKGQRCALVLRFTLDPHHNEKASRNFSALFLNGKIKPFLSLVCETGGQSYVMQ